MARYSRRLSAPRREWLVPGLWNSASDGDNPQGRPPGQVEGSEDWSLPLGYTTVGDAGTKIHSNGLVRIQQTRDPGGPPGVTSASHPLGPYTIERIVGTINVATGATHISGAIYLAIFGVFDTGNPYEASGTTPSIDRLRTQEGVMHCASGIITADQSGPAVVGHQIDIRTKRVVVPGKSFYIIDHTFHAESGVDVIYYWPVIKVLVRYA